MRPAVRRSRARPRRSAVSILVLVLALLAAGLAYTTVSTAVGFLRTARDARERLILREMIDSGQGWVQIRGLPEAGEVRLDAAPMMPEWASGSVVIRAAAEDRFTIEAELTVGDRTRRRQARFGRLPG